MIMTGQMSKSAYLLAIALLAGLSTFSEAQDIATPQTGLPIDGSVSTDVIRRVGTEVGALQNATPQQSKPKPNVSAASKWGVTRNYSPPPQRDGALTQQASREPGSATRTAPNIDVLQPAIYGNSAAKTSSKDSRSSKMNKRSSGSADTEKETAKSPFTHHKYLAMAKRKARRTSGSLAPTKDNLGTKTQKPRSPKFGAPRSAPSLF
jgi:hypothetical protein